jgi:hypothetical protein
MAKIPADGTVSTGPAGTYIFEARYFDDTLDASHTDYNPFIGTSTYGGINDLWGIADVYNNGWTPENVNTSGFGFRFNIQPSADHCLFTVPDVRITVYYEASETIGEVFRPLATGLAAVSRDGPIDVVVGSGGRIFTSNDGGANWTARASGTVSDLLAVAWRSYSFKVDQEFIAVGKRGTVTTSPDGITWTAKDIGTFNDLYTVIADEIVVIGGTNEFMTTGLDTDNLVPVPANTYDPYEDPNG